MAIPIDIGPLGDKILAEVIASAGDAWNRFSVAERELVGMVTLDAAKCTVIALYDPEKARLLKTSIDAQLANIKVAVGDVANQAASALVWKAVATVLEVAVPILVQSVLKLI